MKFKDLGVGQLFRLEKWHNHRVARKIHPELLHPNNPLDKRKVNALNTTYSHSHNTKEYIKDEEKVIWIPGQY